MIERKRRNDFVRKREFDMLRKVRREGLSSEQLAALGGSSRIDDSAAAHLRSAGRARTPASRPRSTRSSSRWSATTTPARSAARPSSTTRRPSRRRSTWPRRPRGRRADPRRRQGGRVDGFRRPLPAPRRQHRQDAVPARGAAAASLAPIKLDLHAAPSDFGQAFAVDSQRSRPRPRPRRSGDRLRQRRLRAVRAVAVGADRPRRRARPACRDLAGAVRPVPRHRPAAQVREPGARLRAAVRLVGAAVVLDAQAGRRGGQRGAAERQLAHRGPGRLGLPRRTSTPTRVARLRVADAADAAALGVRLGRAADASTPRPAAALSRAVPQLDRRRTLDMRWLVGRAPVHRAAGSRAHRRARRRPGVLAAAPRRAAHGQPPRPVRRGGDRLLRHLRGLAAVVGARRSAGAHQRLEPEHARRRRCRWSATSRPASSNRSSPTSRGMVQVATVELSGQLVGDIGADAEEAGRASSARRRSSTCRAPG